MKQLVSIVSISYNQEKYIEQAIESFLMQERDTFDIEIIIADDASADGTQQIITKYAAMYPEMFRPILRKKNVGVQNNLIEALTSAKGKYIALCEGDDFWTDPSKLQRQVDYLESHQDSYVCFHPVGIYLEGMGATSDVFPEGMKPSEFTLETLLGKNFIQTNSVMYRRLDTYANLPNDILPFDWYLHTLHAKTGGEIGYIDTPMSMYRKHPGGIWWQAEGEQLGFWRKNAALHMRMHEKVIALFEKADERHRLAIEAAQRTLINIVDVEASQGDTEILKDLAQEFGEFFALLLITQHDKLAESRSAIAEISKTLQTLSEENNLLVAELEGRIRDYEQSGSWKITKPLRAASARLARKKQ